MKIAIRSANENDAEEMLKIYERIRAENCEKIGEKPLNFMKSRENYVQIAQKTM